jgi:hypothetical protein
MSTLTINSSDLANIGVAFVQYNAFTGQSLAELIPTVEMEMVAADDGADQYQITEASKELITRVLNSPETIAMIEARMGQMVQEGVLEDNRVPTTDNGETLN